MTKLLALLITTAFAGISFASEPMQPSTPTPMPSSPSMPMTSQEGSKMGEHMDEHHQEKHKDKHHHKHKKLHHKHKHKHKHDKHGHTHEDMTARGPMMGNAGNAGQAQMGAPMMDTPSSSMPSAPMQGPSSAPQTYPMPSTPEQPSTGTSQMGWSEHHNDHHNDPIKHVSYTKKSWGEDWWSREYRDQGKAGITSATPGSPDGEMSK